MLPKNVDFFFLYLKIIYNAISLGNGLEAKKKFGIWWTKIGEGRSPSLLLNKSRCQQENASVGKWTLFGWRRGSSMDLNSKPKVCWKNTWILFSPKSVLLLPLWNERVFLTQPVTSAKLFNATVWEATQVCALFLHFPERVFQTMAIVNFMGKFILHLLDDLHLPELCRWTFLQHCICILFKTIIIF